MLLKLFCSAPDSGSFLIFNDNHNKCIKVESATSITVAPCDPHAKEQQFRWASESRILSLKLKLCLGATEIKDWVKVGLFDCDEKSDLQHWQCKNETLFGLKDQDLHLNWGNRNERNLMVYKGAGLWSRWKIFGTKGDLCSKGYQGKNCGHMNDFKKQFTLSNINWNKLQFFRKVAGVFKESCNSVCCAISSDCCQVFHFSSKEKTHVCNNDIFNKL